MIQVDWKPSKRKLRQFAAASLLGFPLIGLLLTRMVPIAGVAAPANLILASAIAGAVVCVVGLVIPKAVFPVYVALAGLAFPIGFVLSLVLLPVIYYLVFTPIALGLRALGKDPLDRALGDSESYWIVRRSAPPAPHYYKQY